MKPEHWRLVPAGVFLFILPYNHTVALRLLALALAAGIAGWQWGKMRATGGAPRLPGELPAWRWVLCWAILPLVLLPFSHDWRASLDEVKTEVGYGLLALLAFFITAHSERALRIALAVVLASFALYATWGIAVHPLAYKSEWVPRGYLGGPGTSAAYFITVLPLVWLAWRVRLFGEGSPSVIAPLVLFALALVAGALTGNRMFFVALAAQIAALLVLHRLASGRRVSPLALAAGGLALVAALAVIALVAVRIRFGPGADFIAEIRRDPRLENWGLVVQWISERPWTGYGYGRGMMKTVFPAMWERGDRFWHAHNMVLAYGFELGVAGIVALLGLFGALLAHWWRLARAQDRLLGAIGTAGVLVVVGVFLRNMTDDFFRRDLALLFWALMGLFAGVARARMAR